LASAYDPQKPGEFELAVAYRAGADALDELPLGGRLEVEGPFGNFVWQPEPRPAALLVGVGTGIAPLRALVEEELARASPARLLLLAGHRAAEDILFAEDFAQLAAEHARFTFMPSLTLAGPDWSGKRGRVQTQLDAAVGALGEIDAYVCGRLDMVSTVVTALATLGVAESRIRSEGF
jgi:NAD(P)H-flavin reductase